MISVMKPKTDLLLILITITLIIGCKSSGRGSIEHLKKATSAVDYKRLVNADNTPGDWLSYGRNYAEDRYSTLEQITTYCCRWYHVLYRPMEQSVRCKCRHRTVDLDL